MRLPLLVPIAVLLALAGPATTAPPDSTFNRGVVASAGKGMVSAADPRAAEAGAEMLRQGGSAADAAFATLLALNVVEPQSSASAAAATWSMRRAAVPR